MKNFTICFKTILLFAFCLATFNLSAQSGDFEFLFDTDEDKEGWVTFNGGAISVASGSLTYTYGISTDGFQLNPPSEDIYVEKANYPYLAMQLSHQPAIRTYMYCKVNGVGAWYGNKVNAIDDAVVNAANVFYYDLSGDNFPDVALADGKIDRLIFNLEDGTHTTVDVDWIKTFASVEAIKTYANIQSTDLGDDVNQQQTKVISGRNKIYIQQCELNAKVEVFDISGRFVHSSVATTNELSIASDKGIFIVKVSGDSTITQKVVVF
ncbi:DUF6383 domain-containing protein [Saccharicrinis sp. 156]|uniref:DUF6383 domain-containing protein n=1 Tax=Saccharicrinis sp. 156 TaxID=3417574 RepID=UPI003D33266B